jgi:hypothetical protein
MKRRDVWQVAVLTNSKQRSEELSYTDPLLYRTSLGLYPATPLCSRGSGMLSVRTQTGALSPYGMSS